MSETDELTVQGSRLLLYVEGEHRSFNQMSVADMRACFDDADIEALNDEGYLEDETGGYWIDLLFAVRHYERQLATLSQLTARMAAAA